MLINMKQLIFTFFILLLLSSCASQSYDDQSTSLSSESNQETKVIQVNNAEGIDVKPEEREVLVLSVEDWESKRNKDTELTSTEKVMAVVLSPITVPVALISLMASTLADGIVELWE